MCEGGDVRVGSLYTADSVGKRVLKIIKDCHDFDVSQTPSGHFRIGLMRLNFYPQPGMLKKYGRAQVFNCIKKQEDYK